MRTLGPRGYCLGQLGSRCHGTDHAFTTSMSSQKSAGPGSGSRHTDSKVESLRFGPAGWMYKDWDGTVYPRPKPPWFDQLRYISEFFDTVEINSSYYGPPLGKSAGSWCEGWKTTRISDSQPTLEAVHPRAVLQCPWSFRHTEPNREWLGDVVRTFSLYPLVVEVRHESWLVPEFLRTLEEDGVGFVNIDQPLYHDSIGPTAHLTSHVGYFRVHGRNYKDWFRAKAPVEQRYNYLYRVDELTPWADRAREIASDPTTGEAYVITKQPLQGESGCQRPHVEGYGHRGAVNCPSTPFTRPIGTFCRISPSLRTNLRVVPHLH